MKKLLGALLVVVLTVAGCSRGRGDETFIYPTLEIENMDIAQVSYKDTSRYLNDVMTGLVKLNDKQEYVNSLAKDIKKSDDGLKYTITIRDDAQWIDHNGEVVRTITAEDFEYAWKRMVDPSTASVYAYIFEVIKNGQAVSVGEKPVDEFGVTVIDDTTFEVELEYIAPYFETMLAFASFFPQPKGFVEEQGKQYGQEKETTLYNGAFYPESYDKSTEIILIPNENYFDKENVQVSKVVYRTMNDGVAIFNAFKAGELSFATFPTPEDYEEAVKDKTATDALNTCVFFASLNQESELLSNLNLRKALQYGLDSQEYVDTVFGNGSEPVTGFIPKGLTEGTYGVDYREEHPADYFEFDVDKATEYLEKAMKELKVSKPEDIKLGYLVNDSARGKKTVEYIQQAYKKNLGITIDAEILPSEPYIAKRKTSSFDIAGGGWCADYSDPSNYVGIFKSTLIGELNTPRYSNKDFDKAYDEAVVIPDVEERLEKFAELEKQIVQDDAIILPLYQENTPYVTAEKFTKVIDPVEHISNEFLKVN